MIENYGDKVKRFFRFTKEEYRDFICLVILFGFILSFTQWGTVAFDAAAGFKSWLIACFIVALGLFVHHAAQRLIALYWGFRAQQKIWLPGLALGLVLVFLSNGNVMLFTATRTFIHVLPVHRLGKYRYGPNLRAYGSVCMFGPLANVLFAAVAYVLSYAIPGRFLMDLAMFSLVLGLWNALPIPPLDGGKMFYASRLIYSWWAGAVLGFIGAVWALGLAIVPAILVALVTGTIIWLVIWIAFERHL